MLTASSIDDIYVGVEYYPLMIPDNIPIDTDSM